MSGEINCTLCGAATWHFYRFRSRDYHRCKICRSILMDPSCHLAMHEEKNRYDQHNNDVYDPGYRRFVKPLVDLVIENNSCKSRGLDFGAGPGPVAATMLGEAGFMLECYDPHYLDNRDLLRKKYNFIICCEVIEHFRNPFEEFSLLRLLLEPGGSLYCMTELYRDECGFNDWYYKNDPTHIFFYHRRALEWIKNRFGFQSLIENKRLIRYAL